MIVPVFDREPYVRESVESVLATGYPALEVLVVDDGSTDGTSRVLEEIRARSPEKIRVLRHSGGRNLGSTASRNLALSAAGGEYVCFLDSDDIMLPHRFERSVELLDGDPSLDGVVEVTDLLFEDDAERERWGDRRLRYGPRSPSIPPGGFLAACLLEKSCSMHTSNILVRARLFGEGGSLPANAGAQRGLPPLAADGRLRALRRGGDRAPRDSLPQTPGEHLEARCAGQSAGRGGPQGRPRMGATIAVCGSRERRGPGPGVS